MNQQIVQGKVRSADGNAWFYMDNGYAVRRRVGTIGSSDQPNIGKADSSVFYDTDDEERADREQPEVFDMEPEGV